MTISYGENWRNNCWCVDKGAELYSTLKAAIMFMSKALKERGRILILGEQGVNRSATLAVSFLMNEKLCTLEDAFYYVKSLRPSCQPCPLYMDLLSKYEVELFGKKLSSVEDLWWWWWKFFLFFLFLFEKYQSFTQSTVFHFCLININQELFLVFMFG